MIKKIFNAKNIIWFVFLTFIVTITYLTVQMILAPTSTYPYDLGIRVKGDYAILLVQCILGALTMLLPGFIKRKFRLSIPSGMVVVYAVFLYCAIYLGTIRNFYYIIPYWDIILHTFSGIALGALGFSIVSLLNKAEVDYFSLSPGFVAMFAFCFAMALGVIWEIYQFVGDIFLNTNMQKYALECGTPLVGQAALVNTMIDLIVKTVGAFVISVIGYVSLKHKKGWLDGLELKNL